MGNQTIIKSKILNNKLVTNINTQVTSDNIKVPIVDFDVDAPNNIFFRSIAPPKKIKIRDDIVADLSSIKNCLNLCGIPLVCELLEPRIENNNLSIFAKVGLEIRLHPAIAMNLYSTDDDDYYVGKSDGADKNILNVYGAVRKENAFELPIIRPEKKIYEIYDVRQTYKKSEPKIKKIFKNMLNISNVFKNFGFLQMHADRSFFHKSIFEKSNWGVFYKPAGINKGSSHLKLLETVYEKNSNSIWLEKEKIWDGKSFNG